MMIHMLDSLAGHQSNSLVVPCKSCSSPLTGSWELVKDASKDGASININCLFDSDGEIGEVNPYCLACYPNRISVSQLNQQIKKLLAQLAEKTKEVANPKTQLQQEMEKCTFTGSDLTPANPFVSQANHLEIVNDGLRSQLEERNRMFEKLKDQAKDKIDALKRENITLQESLREEKFENSKLREMLKTTMRPVEEIYPERGNKEPDWTAPSMSASQLELTGYCIRLISDEAKKQLEQLDNLLQDFEAAFPSNGQLNFAFDFSTVRTQTVSNLERFVKEQVIERLTDSQKGIEMILEQKEKDKLGILESYQELHKKFANFHMPEDVINQLYQPITTHIDNLDKTIAQTTNFLRTIEHIRQLFADLPETIKVKHIEPDVTPAPPSQAPAELEPSQNTSVTETPVTRNPSLVINSLSLAPPIKPSVDAKPNTDQSAPVPAEVSRDLVPKDKQSNPVAPKIAEKQLIIKGPAILQETNGTKSTPARSTDLIRMTESSEENPQENTGSPRKID